MSGDEFVHRRVLRAPRDLVWRCLTEPAELARFWGPRGMTTPVDGIVVELRPGGRFETLMVGPHGSHRMVATFTEVVPPERLAWLEPASGLHTTSTLADLGPDGTAVVIHQRHVPTAMRTPEARAGFLTSLDKLDTAPWDAPSLCEKWLVRHVVAHVTMPVRLTPTGSAPNWRRPAATSGCSPTPWPNGTPRCRRTSSSTSSARRNCTAGCRPAAARPAR